MIHRRYARATLAHTYQGPQVPNSAPVFIADDQDEEQVESANLVASLTTTGFHAPVLDLDFPARLVPSSTTGHYHLYLDKELTWQQYRHLLRVLAEVGIIEVGYSQASIVRGASFVRREGVYKEDAQITKAESARIESLALANRELVEQNRELNEEVLRLRNRVATQTSSASLTW